MRAVMSGCSLWPSADVSTCLGEGPQPLRTHSRSPCYDRTTSAPESLAILCLSDCNRQHLSLNAAILIGRFASGAGKFPAYWLKRPLCPPR